MPLAVAAQRVFSTTSVGRGREYFRNGAVEVVNRGERRAVAEVAGSDFEPYRVDVRRPAEANAVLHAHCTCPVGVRGEHCKHLFAALLAFDEAGITLGVAANLPVRIELVPPPVEDGEVDDEIDDAPATTSRGRIATAPPAPPRGLRAERLDWEDRLAWLDKLDDSSQRPEAPPGIELILRPVPPIDARGGPVALPDHVSVELARRPPRRDGTPGARRFAGLRVHQIDEIADPVLRQALQLLAGAAPIAQSSYEDLSYGYGWNRERKSDLSGAVLSGTREFSGAHIKGELVASIVPALCATGRCGVLFAPRDSAPGKAPDPDLLALRWDGDAPYTVRLDVVPAGDEAIITASVARGDEQLPFKRVQALFGAGCGMVDDRLIRIEPAEDLIRWWFTAGHEPLAVPVAKLDRVLRSLVRVTRMPPLTIAPELAWSTIAETPTARVRFTPAGKGRLGGMPSFVYGSTEVPAQRHGAGTVDAPARRLVLTDRAAEKALLDRLHEICGPRPARPTTEADIELDADQLADRVPRLADAGWDVFLEEGRLRGAASMKAQVSSGIDWFDVDLSADFDGQTADIAALIEALREGRRFVQLADGSQGVLPAEWAARHRQLALLGKAAGGGLRIPKARGILLDVLLEGLPDVDVDASFQQLRARTAAFAGVAPHPEPAGFIGELRPYQREGLGWLAFLRDLGFGGCLADDMGLGKTVQVLAMLVERSLVAERPARTTLVVAPRSLVFNWIDEAARFAPGLRVVDYTGADRVDRRAALDDADLAVTTYATLRLDAEELAARSFDYVILDEAQAIKNPGSQAAKASRLLRAEHRLALTGTPVENHLGDLGSIFEFLNPGMLGNLTLLKALASPGADGATDLGPLARALRPFLLRRTKEQVLPDLPSRTEQVVKCRLEPKQRKLYDGLAAHYRAALLPKVDKDGVGRSTMLVLEALLRLRQAACHPALVDEARKPDGSAKLDILIDQLDEVVESGHKALVFSQFTSLLDLVRERLDATGVTYEYLDGATRDRKERVARFQEDAACHVFLISLKAGGTGLNLTAADYVFLLDPWWNPAVEAQAIDRAHRIGQTRPVVAYRLIAEDTVEDKILALQARKRELAAGIFADEAGGVARLSRDDLALLLE